MCFVRKVQRDTSVSVDERRYYLNKKVAGQYVTLRVEAASRSYVVEQQGKVIKKIAIRGTGKGPIPIERFVEQLHNEARLGRAVAQARAYQLSLPLPAAETIATSASSSATM